MEDIARKIEEHNFKQARLKTILELAKLYGDLRVQEAFGSEPDVPQQHMFDFTDLAAGNGIQQQFTKPQENKIEETATEVSQEEAKETEVSDSQEVNSKSPFTNSKASLTQEEKERLEKEKEEKDRKNASIFASIIAPPPSNLKTDSRMRDAKGSKSSKKAVSSKHAKRIMGSVLAKLENSGYIIFPSTQVLKEKEPAMLKSIKEFSIQNRYGTVRFNGTVNLLEIDKNSRLDISEPDTTTRNPGIEATGFFSHYSATVKIQTLAQSFIRDLDQRESNSIPIIDMIKGIFDVSTVNYVKETDSLTYSVTSFKRIGSN
ncbi:unnamed protein product [Moneuplotes crassus]|uniref:Uncharacterized protein n=1 Tax=Euplotes crassus TaxID=5936 RepID=A0AAD1XPL0_EUPCR|nr:unnamed protein product [Moneuplotes crassus]